MRVARLHGVGDVRIADEPPPSVVAPGDALVRVTAVGLCGSDLHWFGEGGIGDAVLADPLVLGHEMAGVIEDGPRRGTRVAIDPAQPCGDCETCRSGHPNVCPEVRFAGHGGCDGGLRELMTWPRRLLHPLPAELSDAGGALLEPLGVALHGIDLGHLRLGDAVAVVGCGPIGLFVIQLARAGGATTVLAVEPLEHRRLAALDMGADMAMTPRQADDGELWEATGRRGVDLAVEMAGTDEAVRLAVAAARPAGRVVLGGIPDDDRTAFPASIARRKGLTMALVRRMKETYPRAIALARRGAVALDPLIGQRFAFEDVAEAFIRAATRDSLKTIVDIS
jgi:L-iditol 2-dehydrogenase